MTKKSTRIIEENKNFLRKQKKLYQKYWDNPKKKEKQFCLGITTSFPRPNSYFYLNRTLSSIIKSIPHNKWNNFFIFIYSTSIHHNDKEVKKLSKYFKVFYFLRDDSIYKKGWYNEHHKHTLDYSKILQYCSKINSKYSLILEDDCILKSNFYEELKKLTKKLKELDDFAWIKLYFDDKYRNFEIEDFHFLFLTSMSFSSLILIFIYFIFHFLQYNLKVIGITSKIFIFIWFTILFLILISMSGKQNLIPLKNGINKFGHTGSLVAQLYKTSNLQAISNYLSGINLPPNAKPIPADRILGTFPLIQNEQSSLKNTYIYYPYIVKHIGYVSHFIYY
eukprot:gene2255-2429_t